MQGRSWRSRVSLLGGKEKRGGSSGHAGRVAGHLALCMSWLNDQEIGASSAQLVKPRVEAFPSGVLPCPLLILGFSKCPQKQRAWSMMSTPTHPVSIPLISLHHSPWGGALRQVQTFVQTNTSQFPCKRHMIPSPPWESIAHRAFGFGFPLADASGCQGLWGPASRLHA